MAPQFGGRSRSDLISTAIAALSAFDAHAVPSPPRVVIPLADGLGCGDLGCYRSPGLRTPVLDRLARVKGTLQDV